MAHDERRRLHTADGHACLPWRVRSHPVLSGRKGPDRGLRMLSQVFIPQHKRYEGLLQSGCQLHQLPSLLYSRAYRYLYVGWHFSHHRKILSRNSWSTTTRLHRIDVEATQCLIRSSKPVHQSHNHQKNVYEKYLFIGAGYCIDNWPGRLCNRQAQTCKTNM